MIKCGKTLKNAKDEIKDLLGIEVDVKVNLGRNKSELFSGILSNVYQSLFTVTPFDKSYKGKTSYSYSEYLCGDVVLTKKQ
jgi:uncharacterized protein Veg